MSKQIYAGAVDDQAAAYWQGSISRLEAQKIFQEFAAALGVTAEKVLKQEFAISCLMDKAGIAPEELQVFIDAKMAEYQAFVEAEKAKAEAK